jgi:hypothetical protein
MGVGDNLFNDLDGISSQPHVSVLVVREAQHPLNLSGGREVLIPSRYIVAILSAFLTKELNRNKAIIPLAHFRNNSSISLIKVVVWPLA